MDERSFLRAIADSPNDRQLLESFATWLIKRGDKRGEYLQLELDRRSTERKLFDLESKLLGLAQFDGMDPTWLDTVLPLQVVSPMVGRFYAAPGPNSEPYVRRGDACVPNTIVCVIEALKVFNEIPAGMSGVIADTLVAHGDAVEYGQPLFRVDRPPQLLAGG